MNKLKPKETAILKSAMKLFSEKGFSSTSIQDIANDAGIGKGTIYEYFRSKEDVFICGYNYEVERFLLLSKRVTADEGNFFKRLEAFVCLIENIAAEKSKKMKLLLHDSRINLKPDACQKIENLHGYMKKSITEDFLLILKQGVRENLVLDEELHLKSKMLVDFIFISILMKQSANNNEYDLSQTNERQQLIKLLLYGILHKGECTYEKDA